MQGSSHTDSLLGGAYCAASAAAAAGLECMKRLSCLHLCTLPGSSPCCIRIDLLWPGHSVSSNWPSPPSTSLAEASSELHPGLGSCFPSPHYASPAFCLSSPFAGTRPESHSDSVGLPYTPRLPSPKLVFPHGVSCTASSTLLSTSHRNFMSEHINVTGPAHHMFTSHEGLGSLPGGDASSGR